jgi:hypothetical protein
MKILAQARISCLKVNAYAFYPGCEAGLDGYSRFRNREVFCQQFDQTIVCGTIHSALLKKNCKRSVFCGFN